MQNYVNVNCVNGFDTCARTPNPRDGSAFRPNHDWGKFLESAADISLGPPARPRCAVWCSPIRQPQLDSFTSFLHLGCAHRVESHAESYPCHLNLFCCSAQPSYPRYLHGFQALTLAPRESLVLSGGGSGRFIISIALLAGTLPVDNRDRPLQPGYSRGPRYFLSTFGVYVYEMGVQGKGFHKNLWIFLHFHQTISIRTEIVVTT